MSAWRPGKKTIRHGGDGLNPAQAHDDVGAGDMHRVQDVRVDALVLVRRRAGDDGLDARRLGGCDRHVGRGDVGVAAGGNIASCGIDRDELLSEFKAGHDLQREIMNRSTLGFGKASYLARGKGDVILHRFWNIAGLPFNGR